MFFTISEFNVVCSTSSAPNSLLLTKLHQFHSAAANLYTSETEKEKQVKLKLIEHSWIQS